MTESELFDKFVDGLKNEIKIEVVKSTVGTFEQAAQVALRIDGALYNANRLVRSNMGGLANGPVPMEIGNIEGSGVTKNSKNKGPKKGVCYVCKKEGCRPWKHDKPVQVNNSVIDGNVTDSDSENS